MEEEEDLNLQSSNSRDSDYIRECEIELHNLEYSGDITIQDDINHQPIVQKRKTREDETESSDGFTTVVRKPKRLIRSTSLIDKSVQKQAGFEQMKDFEKKNEICVTSSTELPKQMAMARLLLSENIQNIIKIKYKSPYKVFIQFENENDAEKLLNCSKFKDLDYRCQKTFENSVSYGLIKGVDLDLKEDEMFKIFECEHTILNIKRLKRLSSEGKWIDSESVRICFQNSTLPPYAYAYGCRFKVEPFVFPVTQCFGCWKFGHYIKFCPSKKMLCPKCGNSSHTNCSLENIKCLNCKGSHFVLDRGCPMFAKEKEIRLLMSEQNITYKKALEIIAIRREEKNKYNSHNDDNTANNVEIVNIVTENNLTTPNLYSDVVKRKVGIRETQDLSSGSSGSENGVRISTGRKLKRVQKQRRQRNNEDRNQGEIVKEMEVDNHIEEEENDTQSNYVEKEENKIDVKKLLEKLYQAIMSKKTFEEKIGAVVNIIIEECKTFIVNFFNKFNLFESILEAVLNNGQR
ncbi:uncharacterized protein LOC121737413 [Aricia agestis]|uniref:uncharacterized protein LOC121737413 n=1 Tax=Aricia agestis TaxID=91739 RepID=UPI001C20B2E8|nr:uncharacterized protein LOC121737413 [Aricia agestis]